MSRNERSGYANEWLGYIDFGAAIVLVSAIEHTGRRVGTNALDENTGGHGEECQTHWVVKCRCQRQQPCNEVMMEVQLCGSVGGRFGVDQVVGQGQDCQSQNSEDDERNKVLR